MKLQKSTIFRSAAAVVGAYHVLLGLLGLFGPGDLLADGAKLALGVEVEPDGQVLLATRFAGSYLLAFGVMMLILASRPQKYRALVIPALLLFGVRVVVRLVSFDSLSEAMGVSTTRNIVGIVLLLLFFTVLLVTRPRATT
jgi:hypothetical protein